MPTPPDDHDRARALAPTERDASRTERDASHTEPLVNRPAAAPAHYVGRFRIDAPLGSGGMADVYRAHDPVLDRAVALKVLHTKRTVGDTQGMRRVLREARAAAALTHPNTVVVFEVGEADGDVFIAMELLEGTVLREVLARGRAPLEDKLRWLLQAARALAAAHQRGLVHRDVKPENMFVCADGSLKLLDFGIAKRDEDEGADAHTEQTAPSSMRTQAGRRLGTPRYMAPEQHAGLATDPRTDEYAWGLVAFELLCGSHVAEQATAQIEGDAPTPEVVSGMVLVSLRAAVPELPESIAASIARALEPNKEARFPSMEPIIQALETAGSPKPAAVPPPRKRGRRRWMLPTLVGGTLLVLGAGLGIVRLRERTDRGAAARAGVVPPACRTLSSRTLRLGTQDRMAVLPSGSVVFARTPRSGLKLERETPGTRPFLMHPGFAIPIWELQLQGLPLRGVSSLFTALNAQEGADAEARWSLLMIGEDGSMDATAVHASATGFAATSLGDQVVVLMTALPIPLTKNGPRGVVVYSLADRRTTAIEDGVVSLPAIAALRTRLGLAYAHGGQTHFALLDEDLRRLGDVMTALPFPAATALAFRGNTAILYWSDASGGKTRLRFATYTPGDAAFTAPQVALDDHLLDTAPLTVRLADESFLVAWVTSNGGPATLRVSPVGAGGVLTGPSDIATEAVFKDLQATMTPQGVDFSWNDGAGAARIAQVSCQPPTSLPDR